MPPDSQASAGALRIALIIPALNEEQSIGRALADAPAGLYSQILVVDNGSTDRTAEMARAAGACIVAEPRRGYGSACLRGMASLDPCIGVVVFMDADASDVPAEAAALLDPILNGRADLVLGSRTLGKSEAGSLAFHQRLGNRLATALIGLFYHHRYTDLGPFRAIRAASLRQLGMRDRGYGWTIEMQIKAVKKGLRVAEVPVSYRRRIGTSKISGNLRASLSAGFKILWTVLRLTFSGT